MRISCIQLNPQEDVTANLEKALECVAEAAKGGSDCVVLPEMFTYMGSEKKRVATADDANKGTFERLRQSAMQNKVTLLGGSHSEKSADPQKVYNTSVTFSAKGELLNSYRKIHLFNLRDVNGNPLYCESDVFAEGSSNQTWQFTDANGSKWNCLTVICYDLRFPEIFRKHATAASSPDVIFVPAAFTHQTGKDHWEVLLRARAIENQCYVVACNQTGYFNEGQKRNYGHSMVIDPWGNVVAKLGDEVGILSAEISLNAIKESRTKLPALTDRRL